MKVKSVFGFLLAAFLIFASNAFSQNGAPVRQSPDVPPSLVRAINALPDFFRVGDVTGKIGAAKAIILVKPGYPENAKGIGAEGKVRVEIEIEELGNVVSAKAVSGHPSLYEAAQNAALKSKFNTPNVNGQKTKVSGYLNYNFLIDTPNWFVVGYSLPAARFLQPPVIKKAFQADWTGENALIDRLTEIKRLEPKPVRPTFVPQMVGTSGSKTVVRQRLEGTLIIPPDNTKAITVSQELITSLQTRLANDELNLWKFNLGLNIVGVMGAYYNPFERADASLIVKKIIETAPANVSPEVLAELKKISQYFDEPYSKSKGFQPKNNGAVVDISREFDKSLQILFKNN
jgi:TonB family protein